MAKVADMMDNGSREREREFGSETTKPRQENSMQPALNFAREIHRMVSPCDGWYTQSHHSPALSELMRILNPCEVGIRDLLFESKASECVARLIGSTEFDAALNVMNTASVKRDDPYSRPEPIPPSDLIERVGRIETLVAEVVSTERIGKTLDEEVPREDSPPEGSLLDKPVLTPALLEVWEMLDGQVMTAKELAVELIGDGRKTNTIIKRVEAIRCTGRDIVTKHGFGYYRPDSPPPDLT